MDIVDTVRPASRRELIKPLVILAVTVIVILGGIFLFQNKMGSFIKGKMDEGAAAPQTVSTTQAQDSGWQDYIQSTGSLRAVRGADLSAQAAGVVDKITFESGNEVPAGAVLVRLKPNDDYAKLEQLQAAAELAEQNLKRDKEQFDAEAVSQASIDSDASNVKAARAQVLAQQALIEEKIVKAPFAGRLGIRQVDIGQYLAVGATVVTLQALDPILIDFYVPQQALAQMKVGQSVTATVDTFGKEAFTGVLESINSKVDAASRNVQVRAAFKNADKRLIPGMFATLRIAVAEPQQRVTLPNAAVTYNPYGDTVFVVEDQGKDDKGQVQHTAQQRFVKLGATRGDQVAVESGLKAGEVVVTAGQIKLRNGSKVNINNAVGPNNDVSPTPRNE